MKVTQIICDICHEPIYDDIHYKIKKKLIYRESDYLYKRVDICGNCMADFQIYLKEKMRNEK